MNLDELRTVQSKERRKDSLQHLRDSFYEDVADYIAGLKAERKDVAAEADDPFSSPEVSRLTDEIETAEEVVEAVYERRVGKVVKLASFAAASMPVDEDGMTAEEQALFADLVDRIERNKTTVLDVLSGSTNPSTASGEGGNAPTDGASSTPSAAEPSAESPGSTAGADQPDSGAANPATESATTEDEGGLLTDAMGTGPDATAEPASADQSGASGSPNTESTASHTAVPPDPAPPEELGDTPDTEDVVAETGDRAASANDATGSAPIDENYDESDTVDGQPADEQPAGERPADGVERTTVRITRDVGSIFGVDEREYDLAKEDVVTLPLANAQPLLDREAAERLD